MQQNSCGGFLLGEGNGKGREGRGKTSLWRQEWQRRRERVSEREGEGRRQGRKEAEREEAGEPTFKGTWPMFIETYTATQCMHIGYCRTLGLARALPGY